MVPSIGVGVALPPFLLVVLFVLCVVVLPLVALVMIVRAFAGNRDKDSEASWRVVQETYQSLSRMEKRIDALEEILLERAEEEKRSRC